MRSAYVVHPTTSTVLSLLPFTPDTVTVGLPADAVVTWPDPLHTWPVVSVPDASPVPAGAVYAFTVEQLLEKAGLPLDAGGTLITSIVRGLLKRVAYFVQFLGYVPLQWTAPPVGTPLPNEDPGMTSPGTRTKTITLYPALPVPGGATVAHRMTISGQQVICTHGVKASGAGWSGQPALQAVADAARAAWDTHVMPVLIAAIRHDDTAVYDQGEPPFATATAPSTTVGGGTGEPATLAASVVVTQKTALAGKRYTGRMYLPAPNEGAVAGDGRTYQAVSVTAFQNAMNAYFTAINAIGAAGDTARFAVLSRRIGVATPVTSLVVRNYVATQRRRLR